MIGYLELNMNVFARQSEYEPYPEFYDLIQGVWVDFFDNKWFDNKVIVEHLENNKKVCIVSPELHGNCPISFNKAIMDLDIMICTDRLSND